MVTGEFSYVKTIGARSSKPGCAHLPMELDSVLALASCTKLMTAISALQCIERGLLRLDEDVSSVLHEVGKFGIITGFDSAGQPDLRQHTNRVTLR